VTEVAGGQDHGLVAGDVRGIVGELRVVERQRLRGHDGVVRDAFALELGLPRAEAGLGAVGREQQHLELDPLPGCDADGVGGERDRE
jgi:hypothetical protein